ncbi:AI-2E family transporter [Microbacterium sp. Se5.02b]|uniref:AI-2E family transporter n=1 Tax=Microbacterium sp. Se5.02b TaxID=2864103 RepID=UPI001C68E0EF|nr:AI-2E family transporter [Microbacterium sp. Se5.02b]QYM65640.1 AI-2E family transporter [Microbacterium sp. Se5.02b]
MDDSQTMRGDAPDDRSRRSRLRQVLPAQPVLSGFSVAVGVLLAIALATTIAGISTVLISIFLGMFLALGLDPAVRALERRGTTRAAGVAIVAIIFLGVVAVILLVLVPATVRQITAAIEAAPETIAAMEASTWYRTLEANLGVDLSVAISEGLRSLTTLSSFLAISGGVLKAGFGVIGAVSSFVMVVVLTLYFVASLTSVKAAVANLVPQYRRARFTALLEEITQSVGGVVAGGVTLSAINALVVLLIQLAVGSSIPAVMAIVAFFITLVPMIGSLVFLLIGGVATLFVSPTAALVFVVAYLVYIQIEAYVVTPRIMGRAASVPGVLVIIGAMIGATLLGLLGALVAIPLTASILIVVRKVWIPRQNSRTMPPDDGVLTPLG